MIISYIRTIVLYLVLIAVIRLMGKRQIGQMEASEFVVTMLIANLASIPMQDAAIPLYSGLVPILTVLGVELVLSWVTMVSIRLRRILCGKSIILIENGKLLQNNMRMTRVSLEELMCQLRLKNAMDINAVQYAILENNGSLSVFFYPEQEPASAEEAGINVKSRSLPVTLVEDGTIRRDNLAKAGLDRRWLENTLSQRGAALSQTMLLTLDREGNITFIRKERTP